MCLPGVPPCDPLNQVRSRAASAPTVSRLPVTTTRGYPPRGIDHECQGPRGGSTDVPAGAMAGRAERAQAARRQGRGRGPGGVVRRPPCGRGRGGRPRHARISVGACGFGQPAPGYGRADSGWAVLRQRGPHRAGGGALARPGGRRAIRRADYRVRAPSWVQRRVPGYRSGWIVPVSRSRRRSAGSPWSLTRWPRAPRPPGALGWRCSSAMCRAASCSTGGGWPRGSLRGP